MLVTRLGSSLKDDVFVRFCSYSYRTSCHLLSLLFSHCQSIKNSMIDGKFVSSQVKYYNRRWPTLSLLLLPALVPLRIVSESVHPHAIRRPILQRAVRYSFPFLVLRPDSENILAPLAPLPVSPLRIMATRIISTVVNARLAIQYYAWY